MCYIVYCLKKVKYQNLQSFSWSRFKWCNGAMCVPGLSHTLLGVSVCTSCEAAAPESFTWLLHSPHPLFLRYFSLYKVVLIPQFLAVAHFNPRVPCEAPVPARGRVLVGGRGAVEGAEWDLWRQCCISITASRDAEVGARRVLSRVCRRGGRLQGCVGRRGGDRPVHHLLIGRQQVGGQESWTTTHPEYSQVRHKGTAQHRAIS